MAKAIETLSIRLEFKDAGTQQIVDKIKGSFKGLQQVVSGNTQPAMRKLRSEINTLASAGNKSISTIEGQVTALRALRREADINSKEFKELTADIGKYEKQLNKAQGRKGGGGGARQATQVAGAVVSGGIFGGPEGAVGALGGAALGGVQGAFAGAAIGAQLKGIRELTAGAADYAADIEKLKIALEGVSRVEGNASASQANFASALDAARDATERFNVPQREAVRGVTRLTAAVTGAGGPIADAETTFKNVTAAIKATGGSTEDVKGAITAMVQVFSKGKVSAEELSGQLGERLPGAVTMFAKANEMTLPELQKNLKAGTVGLNELMNFIVELGDTYSGTASKIANSNAEAGARLAVAVQDMQAEIGTALIPIGAQFQNAFAAFIKEITPFLTANVPKIANLFLALAKNLDTLVVAATTAFAVFAAAKIAAIVASLKGIRATLILIKGELIATGLANPFTALAVGAGILAGAIFNASKEQQRFNDLLKKGSVAEVTASLSKIENERDEAIERLIGAQKKVPKRSKSEEGIIPARSDFGVDVAQNEVDRLNEKVDRLRTKLNQITDTDPSQGAAEGYLTGPFERFDYGAPTAESGTGGKSGKVSTDILKAEADALIAQNNLRQKGVQLTKERILAAEKAALEAAKALEPQKERVEINKINVKTANQIFTLEESLKKQAEDRTKKEQEKALALTQIKLVTGEITEEEGEQAEIRQQAFELTKLFPEQFEAVHAALVEAASPLGKFKDGLEEVFESAMDLNTALGEAGIQAVNSFGDAFADFVATGKSSFAEMTSSILQDLARIFAKAALFKALSMTGIGSFLGLAKGGVTKGMTPPTTIPGGVGAMAANGLAVARNGIVPYAKGGLVTKPTLFQYKQGGVGNYGLMGEAGTEAIMPLRRGSNGKLGVESSGGGASNVVINVDASGSNVQGDQPNAKALGAAIGAAVQAELVKQKRPGGLLS
jgi:lambda family phage tail tape measure protein